MYTRAAPGEMYTKAASPQSGYGASRAPVLAAAAAAGGARTGGHGLPQHGSSLLSIAGRTELKLCTWMALAYFFMFTACKANHTTRLSHPGDSLDCVTADEKASPDG